MQQLSRVHTNPDPRFAIMSRDTSRSGGVVGGARVATLGEYRHDREARKQNDLLATLGAEDRARLSPHLELVPLPCGKVLCEASCLSDYVCFPTAGIVSLCHELESGTTVEVAVTGNDGMVGIAAFMGGGAMANRAVVRNAGYGYRMRANVLKAEFDGNPAFRRVLLRYAQALIVQLTHFAVCHGHHRLDQQFRRLLLVSMDLLSSSEVALTQEAVACLLGTRRESITAVAGKLQSAGLIRYRRGRITILDRRGLEADACECYRAAKPQAGRAAPQRANGAQVQIANG